MLKLGSVLDGKYKIISVIGQGGMSTVYLARHQRLNKEWAVKEISREYCMQLLKNNTGILNQI